MRMQTTRSPKRVFYCDNVCVPIVKRCRFWRVLGMGSTLYHLLYDHQHGHLHHHMLLPSRQGQMVRTHTPRTDDPTSHEKKATNCAWKRSNMKPLPRLSSRGHGLHLLPHSCLVLFQIRAVGWRVVHSDEGGLAPVNTRTDNEKPQCTPHQPVRFCLGWRVQVWVVQELLDPEKHLLDRDVRLPVFRCSTGGENAGMGVPKFLH